MKILALDIGSYSVKAIELDVTFGRVELGDYLIERVVESELAENAVEEPSAEQPHPAGPAAGPAPQLVYKAPERKILSPGQIAALRRILADRQFKYERLVVNFPKAWVTTRMNNFPTKDRKTIQNSLAFELEDDIPFNIEEIVHDFALLSNEGTSSTVFTAVALKSDLTSLLSELQMLGLDPDTVTIESWGLCHLLKRAIPKEYETRPVCVVNVGHRTTTIHMMVNEAPVLTHVSTCAGYDLTQAIAQAYNLGFDQADKAKIDGAFLLTQLHLSGDAGGEPITEEQKHFAGVLGDALIPLIREIKQTLMSYKAQYKMQPRAIFITGGSSLIPNMQLFLEEKLQIPVFFFTYMSRVVGQTLQIQEASEAQITTATGLALSQVKLDRNYNINLRKDEFAKKGGLGAFDVRAFQRPLQYLAASLVFVYVNLIAQGLILSSRSTKQNDQLEHAIKSVVGAVSSSVISTYKNSPSTLKNAVTKEIAKYKNVQVAPVKVQANALDVLNKVSTSMPRDMTLDVSLFEIKDGKLKFSGMIDQAAGATRVIKALEDTKLVEGITKDKSEDDPKTKKTKFELSGKMAEAGSGKTR